MTDAGLEKDRQVRDRIFQAACLVVPCPAVARTADLPVALPAGRRDVGGVFGLTAALALLFVTVFGHRRVLLRVGIGGVTPLALAGCDGPLSAVQPAGPAAEIIATLWWVMLAGAATILLLVAVLLLVAFRRGAGPSDERADKRRETVWIKGMGLGFTMSVLAALTIWGLSIGEQLLPRPSPEVVAVEAQAQQWTWRFTYPDVPGRVTEGVLHIPAGRPVDVRITSIDVIHSFWVPRLAGKLDAIPGHVNALRIEAWEPGEYAGVSAEFSGAGLPRITISRSLPTTPTAGPPFWQGRCHDREERHRAAAAQGAVPASGASRPGLAGRLTTVNNNTHRQHVHPGAPPAFFLIGGVLAMLIRAQLASPRSAFMGPEVYNQVFTMHGTIMMFLFAIPAVRGRWRSICCRRCWGRATWPFRG